MRTPSTSKRPEPTSYTHWSKDRNLTSSKQNENLSTTKDNFIAGAKTTSTKGFIIPKPTNAPTGYSKALRTATFKIGTNNLRPSSKAPLREVQDANKDSLQNGIKKPSMRTGSSQQRVDSKEGSYSGSQKFYGRDYSVTSNKASGSRLYGLPPTSKNVKTNESLLMSQSGRKTANEANKTLKVGEKSKEMMNTNTSQDYSLSQRKVSNIDSVGSTSTPSSHRPNYHAYPNRLNRITHEKASEEEVQRISRPKTIHDHSTMTPKQEAKQLKRLDSDSERDTQGSSNSDTIGSSEKKSKLREMLDNAVGYRAEDMVVKSKEVQPVISRKENDSVSLISEEKRREPRLASHISITSTPHAGSEPKGLVGLRNIGNTCFMNSTLQCLFNTPLFTDYFLRGNHLKEKNPRSKGLADAFASLLEKMRSHKGAPSRSAESTHDVKNRISKVNPIFSGYEQHDAQELLKAILEGINDDLNRVVTKPPYKELTIKPNHKLQDTSDEWFDYMLGRDNSIVTDLFCGQLLSKTRCTHCNNESLAFDNFWDLALSFTKGNQSNLADMMEQFLKEEDLDDLFHCEKCKVRRQSKKKFVLWRLPKVLVIQLKRFEYTKWRREKINKSVAFPVKSFDLSRFVSDSTDSSVRDCKYTLFGMVNHGGSLSGGHYTAECMNMHNRKWYNFNDSCVSESYMRGDESESSAPYILFYVKSSCLSN